MHYERGYKTPHYSPAENDVYPTLRCIVNETVFLLGDMLLMKNLNDAGLVFWGVLRNPRWYTRWHFNVCGYKIMTVSISLDLFSLRYNNVMMGNFLEVN